MQHGCTDTATRGLDVLVDDLALSSCPIVLIHKCSKNLQEKAKAPFSSAL